MPPRQRRKKSDCGRRSSRILPRNTSRRIGKSRPAYILSALRASVRTRLLLRRRLLQQRLFEVKSEIVQEGEVGSHPRKIISEDQETDDRHEAAADNLHGAEMLFEAAVKGQKLIQPDAG